MQIQISRQYTELLDPRVYNGCAYKSRRSFRPLETLESGLSPEEVNQRLEFWVDLNNYAVSKRGETSRNKYRIVEDKLN